MSVLNIVLGTAGADNIVPRVSYIQTNNTIAEVTATGYLNQSVQQGYAFQDSDMCLVSTKTTPSAASVQVGWFEIAKSGTDTSLAPTASPGSVTLPTVANQIAYATDVSGSLAAAGLTTALFNAGNVAAGLSGTAGILKSYPATASKGYLGLVGVANTGNTAVNISNVAYGQASTVSFADVGSAAGRFLVANTATPFTSGNFPQASGTGGLMVDSGVAVAALQLKANIKAGLTANIGGAGAGPIDVAVTGATSSSIVVCTVASSSNAVSVLKAVTATGKFSVTFSADPGASCILNYVVFIAAQ